MQLSQPVFMGRRGLQPSAAPHSPKAAMSALQGWAQQHPRCYRQLFFTCPAAENLATGVKILNSQVNDTSRIWLWLLGSPWVGCSPVGQQILSDCLGSGDIKPPSWKHDSLSGNKHRGFFSGDGSLMRSAHGFMQRHRATSAFFRVLED